MLIDLGLMEHVVNKDVQFEDDYFFYNLTPLNAEEILKNYSDLKKIVLIVNSRIQMSELVFQFLKNVKLEDRTYLLKTYKKCFIGSEAVSYLSEHLNLNRSIASKLGELIRQLGVFHHVVDDHIFIDGYFFYYLKVQNDLNLSQIRTKFLMTSNRSISRDTVQEILKSDKITDIQRYSTIASKYRYNSYSNSSSELLKESESLSPIIQAHVEKELEENENEFMSLETLKIVIGTWNVAGNICEKSIRNWIQKENYDADIYAIG